MKTYDVIEFKNILDMLEVRYVTHHDKIAFYQKNKNKEFDKITYAQLKCDVDYLKAALLDMGLKGKKIAIIGKNRYEWALSYLATLCGVGVVVPLDKQLSDHEIKNCLDRVDVEAIIYSNEFEERLKKIASDVKVKHYINMDDDIKPLINKGERLINNGMDINEAIDNEALAALLFTSGTTSNSKVVMLSQKNIMSNVKAGQMMVKVDENDTFLSILPLNHTLESTCVLLFPLASGAAIAYGDNLKNLPKDMKTIKPTTMMVVPRVTEAFYDKIVTAIEKKNKVRQVKLAMKLTNLLGKKKMVVKRKIFKEIHDEFGGKLRLLMMGGAPVNPKISAYFRDLGILAIQGYGLTECAPLVTLNSDTVYKDDSTGMVMPGSDVIITNPDEYGIGEIAVKGPQVMLGYYGDEEATKAVMKDGYLYTGDLGKFDKDGFLRILGRCKNVIVSASGKNIFPEEIESLLNENHLVKESLVYEDVVNNRGKLTAEVVITDIIKQKILEHPEAKEEIKKVLLEYLSEVNKKLSDYKRVHDIKIRLTEFEKTSTLKIKRFLFNKQN
ncbi:MAG: AMP-binding protein [Bacilli bacterium]|nr:AMP-binding protein [Bacilli bacterium]